MDDAATPGQFWCNQCGVTYPDTIEETHKASHGYSPDEDELYGAKVATFWTVCAAIGVVCGLFVATYK